jgi:hypothetical protein
LIVMSTLGTRYWAAYACGSTAETHRPAFALPSLWWCVGRQKKSRPG